MVIHPELQKQIEAVASVWTKHTARYADCKAKIERSRQDLDDVEQTCDDLEARMTRIRENFHRVSPESRTRDECELQQIGQDLAQRRVSILDSRKKLNELEVDLEAIWDVWKQV